MQALVDMVNSFTSVVRWIILGIIVLGAIFSFLVSGSIYLIAPQVSDDFADRAEVLGERAIESARQEARARDLAEDGWGYAEPRSHEGRSRDADGESVGGWADD